MFNSNELLQKQIIAHSIANKQKNDSLLKECIYNTLIKRNTIDEEDIDFLIKSKKSSDPRNISLLNLPKFTSLYDTQLTGTFKKITKYAESPDPIKTDLIKFKEEYDITSNNLPLTIYYTILKVYESGSNIFLPYKNHISEKLKLPYKILSMYIGLKQKNDTINLSDFLKKLNIIHTVYFNYALKNIIYMFPNFKEYFSEHNYDKIFNWIGKENISDFWFIIYEINNLIKLSNKDKNLVYLASICYVLINIYDQDEKNILKEISSLANVTENSLKQMYNKIKNNKKLYAYLIHSIF